MGFIGDVAVVGGCGRVGLPLGLGFAEAADAMEHRASRDDDFRAAVGEGRI